MAWSASFACYIAPNNCGFAGPDSSCDTICNASSCPGGTITLPAGYTGSIGSRQVQTKCNSSSSYSCYCGAAQPTNLKCASGYYGTPSYSYNGTDLFVGCNKCPSNSICSETGFTCKAGYYKSLNACISCWDSTGNMSATSEAGGTSVNDCYIPSGVNITDTIGIYSFTSKCYYTGDGTSGDGELKPLPII